MVNPHKKGKGSAVCLVATRAVLGRSVEAQLSFMDPHSSVSSDHLFSIPIPDVILGPEFTGCKVHHGLPEVFTAD